MELYVLRHGIAEDAPAGMSDGDRQLTSEGKRKLREILRVAGHAGVKPTLILTSPLVRAVQTARIAAEELHYEAEVVRTSVLTPGGDPRQVWDEIRTHREQAQLLLSSHNPLCEILAGYLLSSPELPIDFKKGALLRLDLGHFGTVPRGVLRWFLVPRLAGA